MNERGAAAAVRERFYDTIAREFDDLMNPLDLDRRKAAIFKRMLSGFPLSGLRTVDVGCGTGEMSTRAEAGGASVVAVDIGFRLLEITRSKSVRRVVQADALLLPFVEGSFDLVISSECIEHTHDGRRAVGEMLRVLRPGGHLALTCPNRSWLWLIVLATRLGVRPFRGIEEPPGWDQLESWVRFAGGEVVEHFGLHALPFQLPFARLYLPGLDAVLRRSDRVFVNQCLLARKASSGSDERWAAC